MKDSISISEILFVLNGGPPMIDDPESAKRGIRAHKEATERIVGGDIPPSLQRAGLRVPIVREKLFETDVGDGLLLRARADLAGDGLTVDLKPGEIRGRQLLQVAATCAARETKGAGAVYLYQSGQTYLIDDGGESARPEIEAMAKASRRILDIQSSLENNRRTLSYTEKQELGRESVRLGRELQTNNLVVAEKVKKRLTKIA